VVAVTDAGSRGQLQGVNVLFVLPTLGLAGSERQAFLLARHLQQRHGARVRLLSVTPIDSMVERCEAEGIAYEFFELQHQYRSRVGQLRDLARFAALLRRQRVDVLMPYCMFQNILCALTWRLGGVRTCIWNQRDEGRSRLDRWIERLAVAQVSRFISNSRHGADFLQNALAVDASHVDVVPNGLEPPGSSGSAHDWRARAGISGTDFAACMVANLHRMKDHKTLIDAWRLVVDRWTLAGSPHLLLAGAFHDNHTTLVKQVSDLNLEQHVHFLGEVRDVDGLYRSTDLAVFSSFNEGVPNAVMEGMAHGLAVVGTDCDAIREAVGDEAAALLTRPRDPDDLAAKILQAAGDPGIRARLGDAGRRRIHDEFSVDKMGERMTAIILDEWTRSQ
jgi:glycosyltransferase involved in cell wall biosynthesis